MDAILHYKEHLEITTERRVENITDHVSTIYILYYNAITLQAEEVWNGMRWGWGWDEVELKSVLMVQSNRTNLIEIKWPKYFNVLKNSLINIPHFFIFITFLNFLTTNRHVTNSKWLSTQTKVRKLRNMNKHRIKIWWELTIKYTAHLSTGVTLQNICMCIIRKCNRLYIHTHVY